MPLFKRGSSTGSGVESTRSSSKASKASKAGNTNNSAPTRSSKARAVYNRLASAGSVHTDISSSNNTSNNSSNNSSISRVRVKKNGSKQYQQQQATTPSKKLDERASSNTRRPPPPPPLQGQRRARSSSIVSSRHDNNNNKSNATHGGSPSSSSSPWKVDEATPALTVRSGREANSNSTSSRDWSESQKSSRRRSHSREVKNKKKASRMKMSESQKSSRRRAHSSSIITGRYDVNVGKVGNVSKDSSGSGGPREASISNGQHELIDMKTPAIHMGREEANNNSNNTNNTTRRARSESQKSSRRRAHSDSVIAKRYDINDNAINGNGNVGNHSSADGPHNPHNDASDGSGDFFDELQLINVVIPPGRSGIAVNPQGGGTSSYIIKINENSPLRDKVQWGDRIVAVNGEDVSMLNPVRVSKILGGKRWISSITILRERNVEYNPSVEAVSTPGPVITPPAISAREEVRSTAKAVDRAAGIAAIEIAALPGKLGIIIANDNDDVTPPSSRNFESSLSSLEHMATCVVSRVKDDSPLRNIIRVGDRIVGVDGEDVSKWKLIHVSKLLGSKSRHAMRKIAVLRYVVEGETSQSGRCSSRDGNSSTNNISSTPSSGTETNAVRRSSLRQSPNDGADLNASISRGRTDTHSPEANTPSSSLRGRRRSRSRSVDPLSVDAPPSQQEVEGASCNQLYDCLNGLGELDTEISRLRENQSSVVVVGESSRGRSRSASLAHLRENQSSVVVVGESSRGRSRSASLAHLRKNQSSVVVAGESSRGRSRSASLARRSDADRLGRDVKSDRLCVSESDRPVPMPIRTDSASVIGNRILPKSTLSHNQNNHKLLEGSDPSSPEYPSITRDKRASSEVPVMNRYELKSCLRSSTRDNRASSEVVVTNRYELKSCLRNGRHSVNGKIDAYGRSRKVDQLSRSESDRLLDSDGLRRRSTSDDRLCLSTSDMPCLLYENDGLDAPDMLIRYMLDEDVVGVSPPTLHSAATVVADRYSQQPQRTPPSDDKGGSLNSSSSHHRPIKRNLRSSSEGVVNNRYAQKSSLPSLSISNIITLETLDSRSSYPG